MHFTPDQEGEWIYVASFREGWDIAISDNPDEGRPVSFDGAEGKFTVAPTDKAGRNFRGKGMLQYVGKNHLRFAESGDYFIKVGTNSPETFSWPIKISITRSRASPYSMYAHLFKRM